MLFRSTSAGAGKKGVHGCNGFPQRSLFPENDSPGKRDKLLGMEPLRRLLETVKLTNFNVMLGRLPEKELFSRKRPVRRVRLLRENGIAPEKLLEESSRRVKRVRRVRVAGNSPERWLFWR